MAELRDRHLPRLDVEVARMGRHGQAITVSLDMPTDMPTSSPGSGPARFGRGQFARAKRRGDALQGQLDAAEMGRVLRNEQWLCLTEQRVKCGFARRDKQTVPDIAQDCSSLKGRGRDFVRDAVG
jgi:hypothetical protein